MRNIQRFSFLLFLMGLGFLSCGPRASDAGLPVVPVTVEFAAGSKQFDAEVASTPDQKTTGLMNRTELADNGGMLFVWTEDVASSFWMKNTYISLDILFVNAEKRIVYVASETTPLSTDLITPNQPYRYVLEVAAGFVRNSGAAVGDSLKFSL